MTHMHITAWALGIILFLVTYAMYRSGNGKARIWHMLSRLLYVLIVATGLILYTGFDLKGAYAMWYGIKMLLGILVIGSMEMVLVRTKKQKSTAGTWILFVITLAIVLYLGFKLPVLPFS
ncbi:YisL family protein [Ectobacillus antri]|jgi:uncharacterized membrane protein SirB2|uniref:UPF0344 protein P6P90_08105 n=1 Tax=Ectobacillus antri TaxID=2486280 RepID=A0ABT6H5J3_9BACI|nr:YisL family protein [Ectobacillus antri]MDG4656702.1 YisL family protein [Ectobacillus antri]MDG5753935.1 YisL family protein [Ectobacillus antri]